MKFEFDPKHPGQCASEVYYQLQTLAALFGAAAEDIQFNEAALCGLMIQFQAMGKAVGQLEDHLGALQQQLAKKAA